MAGTGLKRKVILGGGTLVGAVVFLAVIVAAQYIVLQHPKRIDMTQNKSHTLAPQSKKLLNEFGEKKIPVELLAFYETKDVQQKEALGDLVAQYRDIYPGFTSQIIDPDRNRSEAIKYKVDRYPTLILKTPDKEERLNSATEESITNGLLKLSKNTVKKVYFLKGHGEHPITSTEADGMSELKSQIEKQNYKVEELVLLQSPDVPEDAALVLIAGAKAALADTEVEALVRYVNKGGALFALLTPFQSPELVKLVKQYGIDVGDDIIIDKMSRVLGGDYLIPVVTQYAEHAITKDFNLASFFPQARSVKAVPNASPSIAALDLALTSQASWTINEAQLKSGDATFDEKTGVKGPISLMAVSTVTFPAEKKKDADAVAEDEAVKRPQQARIVVAGSGLFAVNKFVNASQANKELALNTVSWLAEDENLIAIRPKTGKGKPLILTDRDASALYTVPLLIVLMWIAAGVCVWIFRRRSAMA